MAERKEMLSIIHCQCVVKPDTDICLMQGKIHEVEFENEEVKRNNDLDLMIPGHLRRLSWRGSGVGPSRLGNVL